MSIRLGLCCVFNVVPIKFGTTTATHILKLERKKALEKISNLCMSNANALMEALNYCLQNNIGCFRINSHILPIKTHPQAGYSIEELPNHEAVVKKFKDCGDFAKTNNIRTCFHPDQFVVLNSPNPEIVRKSIIELEYQTEIAQWVNADVINIHAGGGYGDKAKASADFVKNFYKLSMSARKLLTIENDDKTYTPSDVLRICENIGIPFVYDVHHHRVLSDDILIEDCTERAIKTWNREPMFHLSSPINGWGEENESQHHDYINVQDFPRCWRDKEITVEIEAKAKELAVKKLFNELNDI